MLIIVGVCYILMATGIPKTLGLFSSNLSILFNGTVADIIRGTTFGSFGGVIGKSICGYLINHLGYAKVMVGAFSLTVLCVAFEFLNLVPISLYMFFFLRTIQGFFAGLIYSGILAYLGEHYSGDKYKQYIAIITCGLGIAGPLFGLLFIFFDFEGLVRLILLFTIIGLLSSITSFKKDRTSIQTHIQTRINTQKPPSWFYWFQLLLEQKSIFLFAFSFAASLFGSMLVMNNTRRLFTLFLHSNNYLPVNHPIARFIMVIPVIGGGLFFFIRKTEKNFILISVSLPLLIIMYFVIPNIYICSIILMIAYGLHLVLIPVGSDVFTSHQQANKAYYSYIIHTIRSFYTMLLVGLPERINCPVLSFGSLVGWIFIVNLISLTFFLWGRKVLNKKYKNQSQNSKRVNNLNKN